MSDTALRGGGLEAGPPPLPSAHPRLLAPAAPEQPQAQPQPIQVLEQQAGHGAAAAGAAQPLQPAGGIGVPAGSGAPAAGVWPPGWPEAGTAVQQAAVALPPGMPGFAVPVIAAPGPQQAALGGQPLTTAAVPAVEAAAGGEVHHPPQGLHHLTRHWLPEEARGEAVLQRLGAPDIRTAEHMIR